VYLPFEKTGEFYGFCLNTPQLDATRSTHSFVLIIIAKHPVRIFCFSLEVPVLLVFPLCFDIEMKVARLIKNKGVKYHINCEMKEAITCAIVKKPKGSI